MAVVNVSRKKSRASIRRSPPWLRHTIVALTASRNAGQSLAGSAWATLATDRAPVADLRVADGRGQVDDARVVVLDGVGVVDLAVGRPGPDDELVVGLGTPSRPVMSCRSTSRAGLGEPELDERDAGCSRRTAASPRLRGP